MATVGIDIGNRTTKAVVLENSRILSWVILPSGPGVEKSARDAMEQALSDASLGAKDVHRIVATGAGRKKVNFAGSSSTDVTCDIRGALYVLPSARTLIDMGSEECRVIRCGERGNCIDFYINDKCAAGVGQFLEVAAKMVDVPLEEAGPLSLQSSVDMSLSSSCVVFATSEVVSLVHAGSQIADILHAVNKAAAFKAISLARRIDIVPDVALLGGVAKNSGFVACIKEEIGYNVLIPEAPQIVGAIGAALMAQTE